MLDLYGYRIWLAQRELAKVCHGLSLLEQSSVCPDLAQDPPTYAVLTINFVASLVEELALEILLFCRLPRCASKAI